MENKNNDNLIPTNIPVPQPAKGKRWVWTALAIVLFAVIIALLFWFFYSGKGVDNAEDTILENEELKESNSLSSNDENNNLVCRDRDNEIVYARTGENDYSVIYDNTGASHISVSKGTDRWSDIGSQGQAQMQCRWVLLNNAAILPRDLSGDAIEEMVNYGLVQYKEIFHGPISCKNETPSTGLFEMTGGICNIQIPTYNPDNNYD